MTGEENGCRRRFGTEIRGECSLARWQQIELGGDDGVGRLADRAIRNSRSDGPGDCTSYGMADRSLETRSSL